MSFYKKQLTEQLKEFYRAPAPERKPQFLESLKDRHFVSPVLSRREFLTIQLSYIRKGNWGLSFAFFILALFFSRFAPTSCLLFLSACTPYLALATSCEGGRSARYGMEELEMSTAFSLHTIVSARLHILGLGNLLLILLLSVFPLTRENAGILTAGCSLLAPYLLAASVNLYILRRIRSHESMYYCMGTTVVISGICLAAQSFSLGGTWSPLALPAVTITLAAFTAREYRNFIKTTEEYHIWNLS